MNMGFSKNKQITQSQKRRQNMVGYDEENGIGIAVNEFGKTDTTVNQSLRTVRHSLLNNNRIKSSLTVIKPRNKASYLTSASTISKHQNIDIEPVDIIENVLSELPTTSEPKIETETEKIIPEVVFPLYSETKTIQIGVLNLKEIDSFGDLCQKYNLPSWQLTAFDSQTGGAWISYSFEMSREKQNEFAMAISKHLTFCGILVDKINYELCDETMNFDSRLGKFHNLLEDNLYSSIGVKTVSKLLEESESFVIQYNYKMNFDASLNLPPNQLICRQYGNDFGPEVLKFKPVVLDKNQTAKARYLVGLRIMAGLFAAIAGSVRFRKISGRARSSKIPNNANTAGTNTAKIKPSKPSMPNLGIESTMQMPRTAAPVNNKFEYISLKNMNWERPKEKQIKLDTRTNKVRNRQELISRAKELLAQKRSIAELKNRLPMTEGELSMLSKNITFSDTERN